MHNHAYTHGFRNNFDGDKMMSATTRDFILQKMFTEDCELVYVSKRETWHGKSCSASNWILSKPGEIGAMGYGSAKKASLQFMKEIELMKKDGLIIETEEIRCGARVLVRKINKMEILNRMTVI